MELHDIYFFVLAYLVGCFTGGYYLTRWFAGSDIRNLGSGSAGATNVGRILGKWGLVATSVIDVGKAVLVMALARKYGIHDWSLSIVGILVVLGHIFPFQLGFKGGKGITPAFGATFVLNFHSLPIILLGILIAYVILRKFSISGLIGFLLLPLVLFFSGGSTPLVGGVAIIVALVLFAHRINIKEYILGIKNQN